MLETLAKDMWYVVFKYFNYPLFKSMLIFQNKFVWQHHLEEETI